MENNSFDLLNWMWTVLSVPVIWIVGSLRAMMRKLDIAHKRISDHELHVAEKYVRNEYILRLETQILNKLERIEKKIDAKADKK